MPATKTLSVASIALVLGLAAGVLAHGPQQSPPGADSAAKTKAVEDALDRPTALSVPSKTTLMAALKLFREAAAAGGVNIPISVDPKGLQDAGVAMEKPFTVAPLAGRATLRDHLHQVLRPLGMDHDVRDGMLVISSRDRTVDNKIARLSEQLRKATERLEALEKRGR